MDSKMIINAGSNTVAAGIAGAVGGTLSSLGARMLLGRSVSLISGASLGAILFGGCKAIEYAGYYLSRVYVKRNSASKLTYSDRKTYILACKLFYTFAVSAGAVALGVASIPTALIIAGIWSACLLNYFYSSWNPTKKVTPSSNWVIQNNLTILNWRYWVPEITT